VRIFGDKCAAGARDAMLVAAGQLQDAAMMMIIKVSGYG
jgi:hypothetical protein